MSTVESATVEQCAQIADEAVRHWRKKAETGPGNYRRTYEARANAAGQIAAAIRRKGGDANCISTSSIQQKTCDQAPVDAGAVAEPVAWQWRQSFDEVWSVWTNGRLRPDLVGSRYFQERPLYTTPQPTYRDGLLAATEIVDRYRENADGDGELYIIRRILEDMDAAIRAAADALPQPAAAEPGVSEAAITTVAKAICHADGFDPEQMISTTHAVARANYEYLAWEDYTAHARAALEAAARVRSAEGRL